MNCIAVEESEDIEQILENSLVLTAVGVPHKICTENFKLGLYVNEDMRDFSTEQIARYREENVLKPATRAAAPHFAVSPNALMAFVAVLVFAFYAQALFLTRPILDAASSSKAIVVEGAWWRAITSLFLHADAVHLSANIFSGLLVIAVLLSVFGSGLTWAALLVSGALGNAMNAQMYRHMDHLSIGSSTGVFGAVGAWAGYMLFHAKHLVVPLGAALAILGLWGASPESDFMAHFWGLVMGLIYGALMGWVRLPARLSHFGQAMVSLAVLCGVVLAWLQVL